MDRRPEHEQQGRKVGQDLYPTLSEDHQAVIAFGMTPKELIDLFQDNLKTKLAESILIQYDLPESNETLKQFRDAIYPHVIEAYTHGFVLGLMDGAKSENKMVV